MSAAQRRPAKSTVPKRRGSAASDQAPLTSAEMQRLIARAIKRNGDNSILLDMATDIGEIKGDLKAIQTRLEVLEPVTWRLETKRVEGDGQRKLIGGILKLRHAVYTAILAVAGWLGISNFPKLH